MKHLNFELLKLLNFLIERQNLTIKNFLMRMLYKQCGCSSSLYISRQ